VPARATDQIRHQPDTVDDRRLAADMLVRIACRRSRAGSGSNERTAASSAASSETWHEHGTARSVCPEHP
jgi:hypothetical protein